jgi:hypothetical protein
VNNEQYYVANSVKNDRLKTIKRWFIIDDDDARMVLKAIAHLSALA